MKNARFKLIASYGHASSKYNAA